MKFLLREIDHSNLDITLLCFVFTELNQNARFYWAANEGTLIRRCSEALCRISERPEHRKNPLLVPSIDIKCTILHVKFEDGLSVLVYRNRAALCE